MNRAILIGPIAFTLVGAGVGICLAMLYRQDFAERATVHLEDSVPLAMSGAIAGFLVGCGISAMCARWPRLGRAASVVSATLLGAAFVAPIGWIAMDTGIERLPREGMAVGAALGGAMGLVVGVSQVVMDWLRLSVEHGGTDTCGHQTQKMHCRRAGLGRISNLDTTWPEKK